MVLSFLLYNLLPSKMTDDNKLWCHNRGKILHSEINTSADHIGQRDQEHLEKCLKLKLAFNNLYLILLYTYIICYCFLLKNAQQTFRCNLLIFGILIKSPIKNSR